MVFRLLIDKEMEELSTFQATTVKATGIYVFLSLFLRSSRGVGHGQQRGAVVAHNGRSFPQINLSRPELVRP
jgi:hypothetical protein